MRILATTLFPALLMGAGAATTAAPVCTVQALQGEARAGGTPLAVGAALQAGALLQTGAGARLRLRCIDGSTLVLADRSTLQLERFEPAEAAAATAAARPREVLLRLDQGLIRQQVAPGGGWRVRTPTAVTAVRGTEFIVEVGADQSTAVHVTSGAVAVEAPAALRGMKPAQPVLLNPGEAGTQCGTDGRCSPAAAWAPERLRALRERLGGF